MDETTQLNKLELQPFDNKRLLSLCGHFDEHLKLIEKRLQVEIYNRGNRFQVSGPKDKIVIAQAVLKSLYEETAHNATLTPQQVHLSLQQHGVVEPMTVETTQSSQNQYHMIQTPTRGITARNKNQKIYLNKILHHDINFGVGPAGTGKTFLAVACAVAALEQQKVRRIILVRPVVEAGERLGFLPGDLAQKIDPYLRPLYDALHEMLGPEKVQKLLEQQVIEIAPLAYMRGRTLNDAFIILDESQNTTIEQMKMFLTRIGFSSTAVITGDITQIDLPHGKPSGLNHAMKILHNIPQISFTHFNSADVVRHPVVQQIIDAYDSHSNNQRDIHRDD